MGRKASVSKGDLIVSIHAHLHAFVPTFLTSTPRGSIIACIRGGVGATGGWRRSAPHFGATLREMKYGNGV